MPAREAFDWGAFAGMLWMLGAYAVHWLITPMRHPDASSVERWFVLGQMVVGFGGGLWLYVRRRPAADGAHGPAML